MNDAAQDQSPTEPQFSRSVEPTLRRHIVLAVRFQRFACKYFCQLEAEVRALCTPDYQRLHKQEISHLIRDNDSKPSWITNHRLEFLLLEGLPPDILAQRARVHRQRLLALAGEEGAAVVGEAFPAPAPDWSVEKLRSQALGVLMEVQRLRHVQSEFGRPDRRSEQISQAEPSHFPDQTGLSVYKSRVVRSRASPVRLTGTVRPSCRTAILLPLPQGSMRATRVTLSR
jgi:hypothetical protein